MTDNQPAAPTPAAIAEVLTSLGNRARDERHSRPAYLEMESCESIGQLVRRLELNTGQHIIDAYDVLTGKFGLEGTGELYQLLYQVPARWKNYRDRFDAETHVGCVDRTVAKLTAEIRTAGGQPTDDPEKTDVHIRAVHVAEQHAGGTPIDESLAVDVLILADLFDDSRRIQRLSVDTVRIAEAVAEKIPSIDSAQAYQMVRMVLREAVRVARDQEHMEQ